MKLQGTSRINDDGILEIGGCTAPSLVKEFGSPLWVMDEAYIRETCRQMRTSFSTRGDSQVLYASKAFLTAAMCRIIQEEGLGLDVVSGGELYTAIQAGFPTDQIFFHGNNKSAEELLLALDHGVGRIVVDNFCELELLSKLAASRGIQPKVLLRITPGVEAHTHEYIRTGQIDSKFGFTLPNGQAMEAVRAVTGKKELRFMDVHRHIGSQIFEMDSYRHTVKVMMEFIAAIKAETGYAIEELNVGGGLGIYYSGDDHPTTIEDYATSVMDTLKAQCEAFSLPMPKIYIEPGRSIAGPAGTTLYTVGTIKEIPDVRKYVAIDGGMNENLRPALYEAKYDVLAAEKMNLPGKEKVTITGKNCESGDILAWNVALPELKPGDILAMPSTGAYGYAMSGNYNRLPRQAVVLVKEGKADLIVRRETYDDLMRNDVIPDRLK